ncbi:hypothetical protein B5S28_g2859 [[Candida] boidinii]|nr:hypothetical protein B5S28_g2859 [[Candida] boidinii]OWB62798.1 hypothetical protein B5S29_g3745 [[Candida] boidinii]
MQFKIPEWLLNQVLRSIRLFYDRIWVISIYFNSFFQLKSEDPHATANKDIENQLQIDLEGNSSNNNQRELVAEDEDQVAEITSDSSNTVYEIKAQENTIEFNKDKFYIYTDGSLRVSKTNKKEFGGCGVYYGENDSRNKSDYLKGNLQTSQRAELQSLIIALSEINLELKFKCSPQNVKLRDDMTGNCKLVEYEILTDSLHSINHINDDEWILSNMRKLRKNNFPNADFILRIKKLKDEINKIYKTNNYGPISIKYVKGHNDVEGNKFADKLAKKGCELNPKWSKRQ